MVCPSCSKETKGIKLDGKLFCTFCGVLLRDPTEILENSYAHMTPGTKVKKPEPKAPEKKPIFDANIKKHGRARTDNNDFQIIANEPDPIDELELESPHDSLIAPASTPDAMAVATEEKDGLQKIDLALLPEEPKEENKETKTFDEKPPEPQSAPALEEPIKKIKEKPKKKPKKPRQILKNKMFWMFVVFLVLIASFGGLVYYVNTVANDEGRIKANLEASANFSYRVPSTAPPGYKLSYLSKGGEDFVNYNYTFAGNEERFLALRIEPTELKSEQIVNEFIKENGMAYSQTKINGMDFWQTKNKIYVVWDGNLYIFEQSGDLLEPLFLRFATENLL